MLSFHVDGGDGMTVYVREVNQAGAILVSFMLECMDGRIVHHVFIGREDGSGGVRGV